MKQIIYKRELFAAVNEQDNGQITTNPYILAKRHMVSNHTVELGLLNGILAFHGITITQEELDLIMAIKPVLIPYPLPSLDDEVIAIVGKANKASPKVPGAYLLTLQSDGRQYVGGTKQMAKRVRYYYNSKGLAESRPIAKLMKEFGPASFSLSVYLISSDMFAHLKPTIAWDNYLTTLVLALEQYLILHLKPQLNSVLVVGGVFTSETGSAALAEAIAKQMKPVYVYNLDKSLLLYTSKSRADLSKDIGLHQVTINRHLKDTQGLSPLYNTYLLSDSKLDSAMVALMSTAELRESVSSLYSSRIKLRTPSGKSAVNMHAIKLTHMESTTSTPITFASKSQASKYTYSVNPNRAVPEKLFKRILPFSHNGWLVEQA
jgi:hypothetical protein